jgi:rubrerythrin
MSKTDDIQLLAQTFAQLSKAAARRKIYSRKAAKLDRPEVAHFLRAVSASEAIQAHRLFNSLIGRVDTTDTYLKTVFENEIQNILDNYRELIDSISPDRPALHQALSQLQASERRLRSFYSPESESVAVVEDAHYFVCRFCGYLSTESPPEKCPICGADIDAFKVVL